MLVKENENALQFVLPTEHMRLTLEILLQVIAKDLLNFLEQNKSYEQIMLHGFSVGGYMWGEVLDMIEKDNQRYDHVIDRIVGQVWDSAADITEICIGTPRAVFPKNLVMQKVLEKYME